MTPARKFFFQLTPSCRWSYSRWYIFMHQSYIQSIITESSVLLDISLDIRVIPERRAQSINVLISAKCSANMFPNTHSWYHSMSARREEAVSYRCQYPQWPRSLPPPLHAWHWRIAPPRNKRSFGRGAVLWRTCNQTFLSQWGEWPAGSVGTHFKTLPLYDPAVLKNKAGAPHSNGAFSDAALFTGGLVFFLKRVSPIICLVAAMLTVK